jgi:hypothetical protein
MSNNSAFMIIERGTNSSNIVKSSYLKSTAFLSGLTRVEEGGMVGGPLAEDGLEVRSGGQGKPLLAFEVDFIPDEFH